MPFNDRLRWYWFGPRNIEWCNLCGARHVLMQSENQINFHFHCSIYAVIFYSTKRITTINVRMNETHAENYFLNRKRPAIFLIQHFFSLFLPIFFATSFQINEIRRKIPRSAKCSHQKETIQFSELRAHRNAILFSRLLLLPWLENLVDGHKL